jgi:hypothetical protein
MCTLRATAVLLAAAVAARPAAAAAQVLYKA